MVMTEQQARDMITKMFVFEYLPKIRKITETFLSESYGKQRMSEEVSLICGRPVGVQLGMLKIAEPTNNLIDSLVKIYVKETEK